MDLHRTNIYDIASRRLSEIALITSNRIHPEEPTNHTVINLLPSNCPQSRFASDLTLEEASTDTPSPIQDKNSPSGRMIRMGAGSPPPGGRPILGDPSLSEGSISRQGSTEDSLVGSSGIPGTNSGYHSPNKYLSPNMSAAYSLPRPFTGIATTEESNSVIRRESKRKDDLFSVIIWLPFYCERWKHTMSKTRMYVLLACCYLLFVFLIYSSLSYSVMLGIYNYENFQNCTRVTDFPWHRTNYFLITAVFFVAVAVYEIVSTFSPFWFWWRSVTPGEWAFDYQKHEDDKVEIYKISAPRWNIWLRFIIVLLTQIVTYFVLIVCGLIYLFQRDKSIELLIDMVTLVIIINLDEFLFMYLKTVNPFFRKVWGDEEITYEIRTPGVQKKTPHVPIMLLTSLPVLILVIAIITGTFTEAIHYFKELC